jgi:hypothetical protein
MFVCLKQKETDLFSYVTKYTTVMSFCENHTQVCSRLSASLTSWVKNKKHIADCNAVAYL